MDTTTDVSKVQSVFSGDYSNRIVAIYDRWTARDLALSPEKFEAVWELLSRHKTLFSDITRGDEDNFIFTVLQRNSFWFEVVEYDTVVGIIWFGDLHQIVDCSAHMVFFDRRPAEKIHITKKVVQWMFNNTAIHRVSVPIPSIYHSTIRLLGRMGFKHEGTKREALLLGGNWVGQCIYGITRPEVELWDS